MKPQNAKKRNKKLQKFCINKKSPKWLRDSDFDQIFFLKAPKDGPCTNSKLFTNCHVSWDTLYNQHLTRKSKNERKLKREIIKRNRNYKNYKFKNYKKVTHMWPVLDYEIKSVFTRNLNYVIYHLIKIIFRKKLLKIKTIIIHL